MIRIAVLDDYQNVAHKFADWNSLAERASVTFFHDTLTDEDALAKRLEPFEVLCVMRERTPLTGALLRRLPRLKMIASTGNWNAAIDMQAADELGLVVCATSSSMTAAAELTWALVMALARRIPLEAQAFREGQWQQSVGADLHGRTLGVIGLGNTGSMTARFAQAFGMRVIAWSQNMVAETAQRAGAQLVSKDDLFRTSDFISVHVRLSDRTRGLVGARELALMKPGAFLVNTARGPIVDEVALVAALRERRIAGAAGDVFAQEPLRPDHPLRALDNFIGTGHIGYVTEDSYHLYFGESLENIRAWLDGSPIRRITGDGRLSSYVAGPR